MAAKTIDVSLHGGKALEKHLKSIAARLGRGAAVRVGFLEDAKYPAGREYKWTKAQLKAMSPEARRMAQFLTGKKKFAGHVAQIAYWMEFGTKRSPPRPFMRQTVASKSPRWGNALGIALRNAKYDSRDALRAVGALIQGQMTTTIENWSSPPNSKITAELKGFNAPLRDSGILGQSVDFQVTDEQDE